MNIKDLNLKVGSRIRQKSWKKGKLVVVTCIEINRGEPTYYAVDKNGKESVYGNYGDWEIVE